MIFLRLLVGETKKLASGEKEVKRKIIDFIPLAF